MKQFTERGGWWVAGQAVLLAVAAVAGLLRPTPMTADVPVAARLVAIVLAAAGAALAAAGTAALGEHLTPFPEPVRRGSLVESGVYARVRHPIYGGVSLLALAWAVWWLDWLALGAAAALLPYFLAKSVHEERRLAARYPDYAAYRERVPRRILPWIL